MDHIKIEDLQSYVLEKVQVAILDKEGEEQAPFISKTIQKLELCPDHTHLRIYFDRLTFFAIPLTSTVSKIENEWSAYDDQSGLQYVVRKECENHD
ncbi:hypothetical protein R4Z10_01920 [Niallia sp. XMNu-256]|uniref:hypothetical protein n=1 Tax=Niallia sp. XMNu-256 TaxID=3082444 RepID=UPI0030D35094